MKIIKINEEWRPVVGYEGLYEVSNLGNVKSLNYGGTGKEKLLKPGKNTKGYLKVTLYKKGSKPKKFLVSRLVGIAFIPNPKNKPIVDHKDKDKKDDNSVENLQWFTYSENNKKGWEDGRVMSEKQRSISSKTMKETFQIISTWINSNLGLEFIGNSYELVRAFPEMKIDGGSLRKVRNGKYNHHKGWKIKDKVLQLV